MWNGFVSLLGNWSTTIHVIPAAKVPKWPESGVFPRSTMISGEKFIISPEEMEYASWLAHNLGVDHFPDSQEFNEKVLSSTTKKEKFSLLKNIKDSNFYDIIVEVIHTYPVDGRTTLYVTDYTEHRLFYNQQFGGNLEDVSYSRDGDEFGYTQGKKKAKDGKNGWPGPYGKRCLQITAYDHQANFINEEVKPHDWVLLKNVNTKMSNLNGCIEGVLRDDRGGVEERLYVQIIRKADEAERNDVRWKEAVRRKKDYWDRFKEQHKSFLEEAAKPLDKDPPPKNAPSGKKNAKQRRKERRAAAAAAEQQSTDKEQKNVKKQGLNSHVRCNDGDQALTSVAEILRVSPEHAIPRTERSFRLPFINVKYRANVRVVDYFPNRLTDFVVGRRESEYDMLSDFSGGESTDNEGDMELFRKGQGFGGAKTWQWRFGLRVTDFDNKNPTAKDCMWLVVDNESGQSLLQMDAENLREHPQKLDELREALFLLWGDLEEKKSELIKDRAAKQRKVLEKEAELSEKGDNSTREAPNQPTNKRPRPGDAPPPDSDEDDDRAPCKRQRTTETLTPNTEANPDTTSTVEQEPEKVDLPTAILRLPVSNKGFTCCIKEYGVKVPEDDKKKSDVGEEPGWERTFGMFGTTIMGSVDEE